MQGVCKLIAAAAIALFAFTMGHAEAAPQILGLVASDGLPTPMRCRDGACTALLASFCLQQARDAPADGQDYTPGPAGGLTLIAARPDGSRLVLPANDLLTVRLYSGLSLVQVGLPVAQLASLGVPFGAADAISVNVEANPTILPVAAANDPDPQTPQEIALATGPLRRLAAETFDTSANMPDTGKLLGLLINALPAEADPQPIALNGLLRRIVASVGPGRLSAETLAETEQIVKNCQQFPPTSLAQGFCLQNLQRGLLSTLNEEYWAAVGGS
jgi:hypothetical protein